MVIYEICGANFSSYTQSETKLINIFFSERNEVYLFSFELNKWNHKRLNLKEI